jgi:glycosyltransferase involved in cell wall biosynthesis
MGCPRGQRIRPDFERCDTIDRNLCFPCLEKIWGRKWLLPPREGVSVLQRLLKGSSDLKLLTDYDLHIRRTLESADRLVTPSEHTRGKFVEMGVPPDRIHATPYGLPTDLFRRAERTPSAKFRIGYLGSMIPPKGAHVLIEAFKKLRRDDVVLDLHGVILGYHGDDSYEPRLRAMVAGDPRITLHGRYENKDLPSILGRLDALVVPSVWWETYCITIREGFMGRVPVVASRLGALEEAIEDGKTGLLFEPGDSDDLARVLDRLQGDEALRARLTAGSFERVKGISHNAEEMLSHYRAAMAARKEKVRVREEARARGTTRR